MEVGTCQWVLIRVLMMVMGTSGMGMVHCCLLLMVVLVGVGGIIS